MKFFTFGRRRKVRNQSDFRLFWTVIDATFKNGIKLLIELGESDTHQMEIFIFKKRTTDENEPNDSNLTYAEFTTSQNKNMR